MNTQIEDDRLLIVAEKIKLETMARLQRPADSNVSRLEIDAAVQVAQVCNKYIKPNFYQKNTIHILIIRMLLVSMIWKEDVW